MDYNTLILCKQNTILVYVVFKEHTLGYLYHLGKNLYLGILHGKVIKGGYDSKGADRLIPEGEFKHVREATEKDFKSFRVSSNGHLTPYKKTNSGL